MHLLFGAANTAHLCSPAAGNLSAIHHAAVATGCTPAAGGMAESMASPGWTMWADHAVAMAATVWLLARGEAWLWRTTEQLARAASASLTRCPIWRPLPVLAATTAPACLGWPGPLPPRGPPALR